MPAGSAPLQSRVNVPDEDIPLDQCELLRRCSIVRRSALGLDLRTVAAWLGHGDGGAPIARTHSHLRSERPDATATKLAA
jgi:hypothetical protein